MFLEPVTSLSISKPQETHLFKQIDQTKKMSNVMIDIECLSVSPDATILTIGAIKFDRKSPLLPMDDYDKFYIRVNCEDMGFHVDPNTVKWWDSQPKEARYEAIEHPDRVHIKIALIKLSKWIGTSQIIWANSPSFDCIILESAYKKCGLKIPWNFWSTRDCRTIFDLAGIRKFDLPDNDQHHALHDCYRQIVGVKRALKTLGK
jgi:hypothetical protein